jgi:two-component system response regulator RegX3
MDVLVVEDDESIAQALAYGLDREGFGVTAVRTGAEGLEASGYDIALIDLGLPDVSGYEVCKTIRSRSDVPIILITAKDNETDRVVALEVCADDYIVKPFGLRELVARIGAVLRRSHPGSAGGGERIRVGALAIDLRTRTVILEGHPVALTPKEFDLLAFLASYPGVVMRRDRIMREVWDEHWTGSTKTLDVHVRSLRLKLGDARWIRAAPGVGFALEEP